VAQLLIIWPHLIKVSHLLTATQAHDQVLHVWSLGNI
jgi:hypothetical protein